MKYLGDISKLLLFTRISSKKRSISRHKLTTDAYLNMSIEKNYRNFCKQKPYSSKLQPQLVGHLPSPPDDGGHPAAVSRPLIVNFAPSLSDIFPFACACSAANGRVTETFERAHSDVERLEARVFYCFPPMRASFPRVF